MKFNRFMLTVPVALVVGAVMDLILAVLAFVNAIVLFPVMLTKEVCAEEVKKEKERELQVMKSRIEEALKDQANGEGGQK